MQKVIQAKGLVDVNKEIVIFNPVVTIENDKIVAIDSEGNFPEIHPETEILDFPDNYVLPGLINSHAHACFLSEGKSIEEQLHLPDEIMALIAAKNVRLELMSGVTTLRDCGGPGEVMFALRKAIEMGIIEGPRLFLSGRYLTMTGGHGGFKNGVDGPDDVTRAVRQIFKEGADFIKIMATGGGTPGTYPGYASYSIPEIKAATETAHRIGKTVAAHCRGIPGIKNVIEGGVDHIEHACFELPDGRLKFDPKLAEEIAAKGIYVTPTIQLYRDLVEAYTKKKDEGNVPPAKEKDLELMSLALDEKLRSLKGLLDAGVKCLVGNDAGLPYTGFGRLWQELSIMVEGGMSPMQAIVAATKKAAESIGWFDEIGSLEIGKQADLIIVNEDPTVNISTFSKVAFVMKAGKIYSPDR